MKNINNLFSVRLNLDPVMGGNPLPTFVPPSVAANNDPLNEDLTTIVNEFPILQPGQILNFKVTKSEVKVPEDPSKARRWSVCLETIDSATAVDGKPLNPGHKTFLSCQLAPTGKSTVEIVKSGFKSQAEACGAVVAGRNIGNIDSWVAAVLGNTVRCKTGVNPAKGEYKAQNTLSAVK